MGNNGIKDTQTVAADGRMLREMIDGVHLHEMQNIITRNGTTTEVVRPDWDIGRLAINHMIHVTLRAHAISAWHCHHLQTDRIFVTDGTLRIVLFDDRGRHTPPAQRVLVESGHVHAAQVVGPVDQTGVHREVGFVCGTKTPGEIHQLVVVKSVAGCGVEGKCLGQRLRGTQRVHGGCFALEAQKTA